MLSRNLARVFNRQVREKATAVATAPADIDDFIQSVSSQKPSQESKKSVESKNPENFKKWMSENRIESISDYLTASKLALSLKENDRRSTYPVLRKILQNIAPKLKDVDVAQRIHVFTILLQVDRNSEILTKIEESVENDPRSDVLKDVPLNMLLDVIVKSSLAERQLSNDFKDALYRSIEKRLFSELDKPSELIALMVHGDPSIFKAWKAITAKAITMIHVMTNGEICSLMKNLADNRIRDTILMRNFATALKNSKDILTISQMSSLATACAVLSFYDKRLLSKLSESVVMNANVLKKWSDVLAVTNAFHRLGYGDPVVWSTLTKWALNNRKTAAIKDLSRFISTAARLGIEEGRELAAHVKGELRRADFSQISWLGIVHSLAFFQEMDERLADTVLNKDFVKMLVEGSQEKHDRLRRAMMLLQINAATKSLRSYNGPTISKETFKQFGIDFGTENVRQAMTLKYGKDTTNFEKIFAQNLFRVAPRDTHCSRSDVVDSGVLVDAFVMPSEEKNGRVVNVKEWGTRRPRPILYYGWQSLVKESDKVGEEALIGTDRLAIRLLRADGWNPVIVTSDDFGFANSEVEKLNMLKQKIFE